MPIRFNSELVKALVDDLGGVETFIEKWAMTSVDGEDAPHKSTVSRWNRGQWPKDRESFLRLSDVLNVDPFALIAIRESDPQAAADQILDIVQSGRSIPPIISFLHPFFGRQKTWPPGLEGLDRSWYSREFEHDPEIRSNFYACIHLKGDSMHMKKRPQVFHFAFRNTRRFGGRWLQYGLVFRHGIDAPLWHIDGHAERLTLTSIEEPMPIRTWFGPGAATFKVASLHAFELSALLKDHDGPNLTFPA